ASSLWRIGSPWRYRLAASRLVGLLVALERRRIASQGTGLRRFSKCDYTRDLRPDKWGSGVSLHGSNPELLMSALGHVWTAPWQELSDVAGIWEVRGGPQHFVHSKVMAWVAFDRAANIIEAETFNGSGQRWRDIADEVHAEVCERGFDRDLNSFVQAYGSKRLDASLLLIP